MELKQNRLSAALLAKYHAEMMDAIARLEVYINNPVAIGEHPQFTEEMDKIVEQYTNARDKAEALMVMMTEIKS
jgi:methylaspartate ammonia-lyase